MTVTVTTQAELDAVVDSGEIVVIEGDGLFKIRGTFRPNIRTYGTSEPIIWTYDTSAPTIWTYGTSMPSITTYGTWTPTHGEE